MAFIRRYRLTIDFPEVLFSEGIFKGVGLEATTLTGSPSAIDIVLEEHQVTFVTESSTKKQLNSLKLKIFNLPKEQRKLLVFGGQIKLEVGYADEDFKIGSSETLAPIFLGDIKSYSTDTTKADIVTTIEGKDGWVNVREGYTFRSFPVGSTVRQAIEEIARQDLHLTDVVFESEGLEALDDPRETGIAVVGGSFRAIFDLCSGINLQCSIQDRKLIVDNISGASKVSVISITDSSGLIGSPTRLNPSDFKRLGVPEGSSGFKIKTLLNPEIAPNSVLALDTDDFIGELKVITVKHIGDFEGTSWFTEVVAKTIAGVDKNGNKVTR